MSSLGQQHQRAADFYRYDTLTNTPVILDGNLSNIAVSFSQQTQTPTGLHQPLRREATGQANL